MALAGDSHLCRDRDDDYLRQDVARAKAASGIAVGFNDILRHRPASQGCVRSCAVMCAPGVASGILDLSRLLWFGYKQRQRAAEEAAA